MLNHDALLDQPGASKQRLPRAIEGSVDERWTAVGQRLLEGGAFANQARHQMVGQRQLHADSTKRFR
jgi:hypothetical protein